MFEEHRRKSEDREMSASFRVNYDGRCQLRDALRCRRDSLKLLEPVLNYNDLDLRFGPGCFVYRLQHHKSLTVCRDVVIVCPSACLLWLEGALK